MCFPLSLGSSIPHVDVAEPLCTSYQIGATPVSLCSVFPGACRVPGSALGVWIRHNTTEVPALGADPLVRETHSGTHQTAGCCAEREREGGAAGGVEGRFSQPL